MLPRLFDIRFSPDSGGLNPGLVSLQDRQTPPVTPTRACAYVPLRKERDAHTRSACICCAYVRARTRRLLRRRGPESRSAVFLSSFSGQCCRRCRHAGLRLNQQVGVVMSSFSRPSSFLERQRPKSHGQLRLPKAWAPTFWAQHLRWASTASPTPSQWPHIQLVVCPCSREGMAMSWRLVTATTSSHPAVPCPCPRGRESAPPCVDCTQTNLACMCTLENKAARDAARMTTSWKVTFCTRWTVLMLETRGCPRFL